MNPKTPSRGGFFFFKNTGPKKISRADILSTKVDFRKKKRSPLEVVFGLKFLKKQKA